MCKQFVESLVRPTQYSALPNALVRFLFGYIENVYFSRRWWTGLTGDDKQEVMSLVKAYPPQPEEIVAPEGGLSEWVNRGQRWV